MHMMFLQMTRPPHQGVPEDRRHVSNCLQAVVRLPADGIRIAALNTWRSDPIRLRFEQPPRVSLDPAVPVSMQARLGRAGSLLVSVSGALSAKLIQRGLQLPEDVLEKRDVLVRATFHHVPLDGSGSFVVSWDFDELRTIELEISEIGERGVGMLLSHDVLQF